MYYICKKDLKFYLYIFTKNELWASLNDNQTVSGQENHQYIWMTLDIINSFNDCELLMYQSGDQKPLKKRGETEKPYE